MQYFNKLLICLLLLAFYCHNTFSQTLILSENFDNYTGADSTAPVNWYISKHGVYTSGTSSGINPNAFKFSADSVMLVTPYFTSADSLSFWIKGFSTTGSSLSIFESVDSLQWDSISTLSPLPTQSSMGNINLKINPASHYVQFLYHKVSGNLSFDDFELWQNDPLMYNEPEKTTEIQLITLSPNSFYLKMDHNQGFQGWWIYDFAGRLIANNGAFNSPLVIDLSAQSPGLYVLKVLSNERFKEFKLINY